MQTMHRISCCLPRLSAPNRTLQTALNGLNRGRSVDSFGKVRETVHQPTVGIYIQLQSIRYLDQSGIREQPSYFAMGKLPFVRIVPVIMPG